MVAIALKEVYFRYDEDSPAVLKGASYDFEYGKFYLVCGASGGGKSTFLSILNGKIPHYIEGQFKGEVLFEGKDIYEEGIAQRSYMMSSMLQNPDEQILYDKVEDEIAFPLENIGIATEEMKQRVDSICQTLSLDKFAKTRTLSGGEKQRLEGACALSLSNKIILLDEPLANLDKYSSSILLGELKRRVKEENACVILVEHRLDRLPSFIDEVVEIKDGKLIKKLDPFKEGIDSIKPIENSFTDEIILKAENVGFKVKKKLLLENINLTLHKGERLLILGDNGAGKTTLIRLLSKLVKCKIGSITYSKEIEGKNHFKNVGYLFQNPDYQLFMKTVEEEIFLGDVDKEYANHLIDVFGLREKLDQHPLSLSEGQKRKLTFVCVLAKKPWILFLDEPTVGQDSESLSIFVEEANRLVKENKTSLVTITHDRRCMEALMDSCIVIKNKTISNSGGIDTLHQYLKEIE